MKIAFWSNVHGQTATTSNLLAIAIMSALQHESEIALLQSHFTLNNMDNSLIGQFKDDLSSFNDIGIDALLRDIKSAPLNKETVINDSITLMSGQLNLYPCTQKNNRDTYEKDMLAIFDKIMDGIDRYHEDVFIDTASGDNPLTQIILDAADLIVVNLSQNKSIIEDYLESYRLGAERTCFIIGNYNYNSRYNLKNLAKRYPDLRGRLAAVPYCVEYLDAQSEGKTIDFIMKNADCEPADKNYFFMDSLREAVKLIDRFRKKED